MSSKLFAFQVAKPMEFSAEETTNAQYDPQSQTAVWEGGTRSIAHTCTYAPDPYGYFNCDIGGIYLNCLTSNPGGYYYCD